jgi:hypothetical protein
MNIKRGLRLLEEKTGSGSETAKEGDHVVFNLRMYLNRGQEILINEMSDVVRENFKQHHPETFTTEEGYDFVNFHSCLGRRNVIRAIQYSLYGMREGGYRKVKASPHLAFKMKGVPGVIPPNSAMVFEIWVRKIEKSAQIFKFKNLPTL